MMKIRWLVMLLLLGDCWTEEATAVWSAERPNVVVFMTDDESWLERSIYGLSELPTPHFDRVAREGVLMTRCYSSAPSCAPARAAFLTGRNFWELEEGAFIQAWLPRKFTVLPQLLRESGYEIAYTGKSWGPGVWGGPGYETAMMGDRYAGRKVKKPERAINPVDYVGSMQEFLKQREQDQPFFFWMGVTEPHGPWDSRNHEKLASRFGFGQEKVLVPGYLPNTAGVRRERANFLYEVCYADVQLGRLLELLKAEGELENTLLIVTADNGTSLFRSKASPYDMGVHVPMTICWPQAIPRGRKIEDFVNFRDIAPTILEAAGVSVPESMSGRSLLTSLKSDRQGQVEEDRDFMVTGLEWHGELPPTDLASRSIRDERFAYIVNYGHVQGTALTKAKQPVETDVEKAKENLGLLELARQFPEEEVVQPFRELYTQDRPAEEFYDLENDPWQMVNQIDNPDFAQDRERLKTLLQKYQQETGDPRVTGQKETFEKTRQFVIERKRNNYQDRSAPADAR